MFAASCPTVLGGGRHCASLGEHARRKGQLLPAAWRRPANVSGPPALSAVRPTPARIPDPFPGGMYVRLWRRAWTWSGAKCRTACSGSPTRTSKKSSSISISRRRVGSLRRCPPRSGTVFIGGLSGRVVQNTIPGPASCAVSRPRRVIHLEGMNHSPIPGFNQTPGARGQARSLPAIAAGSAGWPEPLDARGEMPQGPT
jgi:hypothetical protein